MGRDTPGPGPKMVERFSVRIAGIPFLTEIFPFLSRLYIHWDKRRGRWAELCRERAVSQTCFCAVRLHAEHNVTRNSYMYAYMYMWRKNMCQMSLFSMCYAWKLPTIKGLSTKRLSKDIHVYFSNWRTCKRIWKKMLQKMFKNHFSMICHFITNIGTIYIMHAS